MAMQPFLALITPLTGDAGGGQPPLGIWGPTDPRPTPPIANVPGVGRPPLGTWGPNDPRPTPPIHLGPGGEVGGPPTIWGPTDPRPTPPIVIPPEGAPPDEKPPVGQLPQMTWHTVWTEQYGWAVVGIVDDPHPTPSK